VKRLSVLVVLAVTLLGASQALARPEGGVSRAAPKKGQDFAISFTVKKKSGKPVKVTKFNYGNDCNDPDVGPGCTGSDQNTANNVPMTCDGAMAVSTYLSGYLPGMKIRQKAFGDKFGLSTDGNPSDAPEATVAVNGQLKPHNKAVGDIRLKGDFGNGTYTNCDSTKLPWSAG